MPQILCFDLPRHFGSTALFILGWGGGGGKGWLTGENKNWRWPLSSTPGSSHLSKETVPGASDWVSRGDHFCPPPHDVSSSEGYHISGTLPPPPPQTLPFLTRPCWVSLRRINLTLLPPWCPLPGGGGLPWGQMQSPVLRSLYLYLILELR